MSREMAIIELKYLAEKVKRAIEAHEEEEPRETTIRLGNIHYKTMSAYLGFYKKNIEHLETGAEETDSPMR